MPPFQRADQEPVQQPDQVPDATLTPRPRRRWSRYVLFTVAWLIVFTLVIAGFGTLWLRSAAKAALPQLDGDIHLAGLSAPVTVHRDEHGVPHIEAATQGDMFVAQGYITAQDRLWQMDTYRRSANGELAEILGPSLLRHDKAQRMFQFHNVAQRVYANLPAEERARYDAYARGVNLFIAEHRDSLPAEFRLLHYTPKPWTGADSISIGTMMVDMLDTHWYAKLSRERIAARLNSPKLESDLYPVGSWRDHPPTGEIPDVSQPHREQSTSSDDNDDERSENRNQGAGIRDQGSEIRDREAMAGAASKLPSSLPGWDGENDGASRCRDCILGSNSWVISGTHTASGKPLLSNDMHLGLNVPNIWYMADLRSPSFHAAGVSLPGVPFIIAGHNDHIAWGFTALYADVQDLYIENVQGNNYRGNDSQWHALTVDHEVIRVRGRKDVNYDVRLTEHGPLLDPIFTRDSRAIALKWTLYDAAQNIIPIYGINTASNWTDFTGALSQWCWPTQNVVYSDDQGHIGYHAVGRIPLRPSGIADIPVQAVAGNTNEWQGYIPFESLPNSFDPPSGFLATANSRVTSDKSKYPLTNDWADPYRAERIYKLLQGRDHLTPADLLAVQTDIYSEADQEMAHRFATAIDHTQGANDRLRKAADLMRNWDGRLTTDSSAAAIEVSARYVLRSMLLESKLGKDDAEQYQWSESNFALEQIVMHAGPAWLPPDYKDWDAFLTETVRRGMKEGEAPSDVGTWKYGAWHVVDLEHPLSSFVPFIGRIAGTGAQPLSGDTLTIKQVGRAFGPSQRFTMDWNNVDGSTENIVLGESGNPYSPYFRDQWDNYYNGRTFPLPFTPAAVLANTTHTLHLLP
jgi:penicillin amidase